MCLTGFGSANVSCGLAVKESLGCKDASISETYLILAFPDRLESWDLQKEEKTPSWSMEIKTENSGSVSPAFTASRNILRKVSRKYTSFCF